jgi:hypothetical protein
MTTMAKRKRASKKTIAQIKRKAADVFGDVPNIPESLRKKATDRRGYVAVNAVDVFHPAAMPSGVNATDKVLVTTQDPLDDLCGEPFNPIAVYLIAAAIAFAGGLGIGWMVWA